MMSRSHELYISALANALRDPSSCKFLCVRIIDTFSFTHRHSKHPAPNISASRSPPQLYTPFHPSFLCHHVLCPASSPSRSPKHHFMPQTFRVRFLLRFNTKRVSNSFMFKDETLIDTPRSFKLRDRNAEVWKDFSQPLPPHLQSASLHTLNRHLLISTPSSSDPATRSPSPCSDSDDERGVLPEDSDSEPLDSSPKPATPFEIIDTGFNFAAEENRIPPYSHGPDRVQWDIEERDIANTARQARSYDEYKELVGYSIALLSSIQS